MNLSKTDIESIQSVIDDACHAIIERFQSQQGNVDENTVTPQLLHEALNQFVSVMAKYETSPEEAKNDSIFDTISQAAGATDDSTSPTTPQFKEVKLSGETATKPKAPMAPQQDDEEITKLGDYGVSLLEDLARWAEMMQLEDAKLQIQQMAIPVAQWVARHNGVINELETIVNSLALLANSTNDPQLLKEVAGTMTEITDAASNLIKEDLEKQNPSRPWRILNMNHGIVATRAHSAEAMRAAFERLVTNLPEDAKDFFAMGQQQAKMMGVPEEAMAVMTEFYKKYSAEKTMH